MQLKMMPDVLEKYNRVKQKRQAICGGLKYLISHIAICDIIV
jgi:hypothetical protein